MKKENSKIAEKLTTYLFYLLAFLFFIAFNFQDSRTGGWYQQWLPTGIGTFTSTTGNNSAKGIDAGDLSAVNLTSTGTLRTGGLNIFDNAGENINNIYVNDSYFYLDKGKNVFGVISGSGSYHLKGYFL